jgi:urease gamma subunit
MRHILEYNTRPLYPDHVAMLNDAWSEFQREMAHGLHVRNRILKDAIDSQPSKQAVIDEYLKIKILEEENKREAKKQEACKKWQTSGANAARKYTADDIEKWLKEGENILKRNNSIKSVRQLAIEIEKELGYPDGARETIRKIESIKEIFKQHNLNKNAG